jgi:hypothetical protein
MAMMTRRKTIVIFRVNDSPVCTNDVQLLAAYRLYLAAQRRGRCPRCGACIDWPDAHARAAYRKIGKRPPYRLIHQPACPVSAESLRLAVQASWS